MGRNTLRREKNMQYIFQQRDGSYSLSKYYGDRNDKRTLYIGSSKSLKQIKSLRKKCVLAKWDYEKCLEIKEEFRKDKVREQEEHLLQTPKYIQPFMTKRGMHYSIQKTINGTSMFFGTYYSLEEAKAKRAELIKNNWDTTKVPIRKKIREHKRRKQTDPNLITYDKYVHYDEEEEVWKVQKIENYIMHVYGEYNTYLEALEHAKHLGGDK